jgi:hypothetical protein
MEQDFDIADTDKNGKVSYFKFNSILKKRLFQLKDNNFVKMIEFANEGLEQNIIKELNENKIIDYKNFLLNLVNYNEQGKNKRDWEEDEINLETNKDTIENEEKEKEKEKLEDENKNKENEIKIGSTLIEEQQVKKNEENEYDNFFQNEIVNKDDNNNDKLEEKEVIEEKSKNEEEKINESEKEKNEEDVINEFEKKSEETKGPINEANEEKEQEENNNLEKKLVNQLVEEERTEKE